MHFLYYFFFVIFKILYFFHFFPFELQYHNFSFFKDLIHLKLNSCFVLNVDSIDFFHLYIGVITNKKVFNPYHI